MSKLNLDKVTSAAQPVSYIGRKFSKDGKTFVVWKMNAGTVVEEYNVVALIDPDKGVETIPYAQTDRMVHGKTEVVPLHRLGNVDPNTHMTIPANKMAAVLSNPDILVEPLKKKVKKVITLRPKAELEAA